MNNPIVSILLPVYNATPTLSECIESVLSQTYLDFKLIIINDGSTDNFDACIAQFDDKRISVFDNKKNCGLIYTLNRGLSLCRGKYIARIDADDKMINNRLELQVRFLEGHPDIVACGGQMKLFGNKKGKATRVPLSDSEIENQLLFESPLYHPTVMMRSSVVKSSGIGYNPNYIHAEDYKLWSDLSHLGKLANLPDILINYRVSEGQVSSKYNSIQRKNTLIIKRENVQLLLNKYGINLPRVLGYEFYVAILLSVKKCINPEEKYKMARVLFMVIMSLSLKLRFKAIFTNIPLIIRLFTSKEMCVSLFSFVVNGRWKNYSLSI